MSGNTITKERFTGTRNLLVGLAALFAGLAAIAIALQWQTHTTISIDPPRRTETPPKLGFTIIKANTFSSERQFEKNIFLLLDRDTGRVWQKDGVNGLWEAYKVDTAPCGPYTPCK